MSTKILLWIFILSFILRIYPREFIFGQQKKLIHICLTRFSHLPVNIICFQGFSPGDLVCLYMTIHFCRNQLFYFNFNFHWCIDIVNDALFIIAKYKCNDINNISIYDLLSAKPANKCFAYILFPLLLNDILGFNMKLSCT